MKEKFHRDSIAILGAILFGLFILKQTRANERWITLHEGVNNQGIQINTSESSRGGITIDLTIGGIQVSDIEMNSTVYQVIRVQGAGRTAEIGNPELPTVGRYIAIPKGAKVSLTILQQESETLDDYNIVPVQEPLFDSAPKDQQRSFQKNEMTYSSTGFFPISITEATTPLIIRGCPVSLVAFFPIRFDPTTRQLEVISHIRVRVDFKGGNGNIVESRKRTPGFEAIYQNLLLNYEILGKPNFNLETDSPTEGEKGKYLIITHADYAGNVQPLADWKHKKGHPTRVTRVPTDVAQDSAAIRNYIIDAYNNWEIPPEYVLLVGDDDEIPPYYKPYYNPATDLYYSAIDGGDWLPDIFVGRLPVDPSSVDVVVNKIHDYERDPYIVETNWYNDFFAAAYYQDDNNNGYADRFFLQTSEVIRRFVKTKGYDTDNYVYTTNSSHPRYYYYGDPIPGDIVFTPNPGSNEVIAAINTGTFWVQHRDHGFESGWGDPDFHSSHVSSLTNGRKLPIMMSINCLSCRFDYSSDSFGETILKKNNGGVVSIVGATKSSYSGYNDEFSKGFYDAVWPDFDPTYPGGGDINPLPSPIYDLGAIFNFGKFWMYDKYLMTGGAGYPWTASTTSTREEFEMFNLLGDPDLNPWTEKPIAPTVTLPETIPVGPSDVTVTVTTTGEGAFKDALVCLMKDTETYASGLTNAAGQVTLHVEPTTPGDMDITVTGHNLQPVETTRPIEGDLSVSGHVRYWSNAGGVRQTEMSVTDATTTSTFTDADGYYEIGELEQGQSFTITPAKIDDIGTQSIVGYDASLALQIALDLLSPTANQFKASDVDNNDMVIAQDAGHIARYAVGLPNLWDSATGDWIFDPIARSYDPLNINQTDQDYVAILLGDVDGNWNPDVRKVSSLPTIVFEDVQQETGKVLTIPFANSSDQEVLSCDLWLEYNPKILEYKTVKTIKSYQQFSIVANTLQKGILRFTMFGAKPVAENGTFLTIEFTVLGTLDQTCDLYLKHFQINNSSAISERAKFTVGAPTQALPQEYVLFQNHPNPFNPQTTISFALPQTEDVSIKVFNLLGDEIITLVDGRFDSGHHQVLWDGTDNMDREVSSGVYIYTMRAGDFFQHRKLVITK